MVNNLACFRGISWSPRYSRYYSLELDLNKLNLLLRKTLSTKEYSIQGKFPWDDEELTEKVQGKVILKRISSYFK